MLALNQCISRLLAPYFFNRMIFRISHIVSKRSFRLSSCCNCRLVGASCQLFSLTGASGHLTAIITPSITIDTGCNESGKPMESGSPESQINTRLFRPGYHHVCSKQWHGNSSYVNMMLLQFRFPDAFSSGSNSIINRSIFCHYHLLYCNLLLLIFSACVFQNC